MLSYTIGDARGRSPLPFKEGAQDAKHPSKGTIGFPSEIKNASRDAFFIYPIVIISNQLSYL